MKSKIYALCVAMFCLSSCQNPSVAQVSTMEVFPSSTPPVTQTYTNKESENNQPKTVLLGYALSWDGKTLATYTNTGIYFYDLPTMRKTNFLEFDNSEYSDLRSGGIAFSPDNKQIAVSGKSKDQPVVIWDIKTKKALTYFYSLPNGHYVTEIEFSPNGKTLAIRNTYPVSMRCEAPEDKFTLIDLSEDTTLFELDKCVIYPPIQFRFTYDDRIFLYFGSMSPAYSIYWVESNIGKVISKENLEWTDNEHFYDVSPDGKKYLVEDFSNETRVTKILDSQSNKTLKTIEGRIQSFYKENGFITSSYTSNPQWSFWEEDKPKCIYDGVTNSPQHKISQNGEILVVMKSYTEYQIWNVPTCSMIGQLQFDE
ncbi:MAG: WD40 repeat domain-containing protein [Anaerolineales bacterium]